MISLPALTPLDQATQRSAGSWDQLYKEAASDFPTHEDFKRYREEVEKWMTNMNERMVELTMQLALHTHPCSGPGGISGPPTNKSQIKWSGKIYILPSFLNTTTIPPNIRGTPGYKFRPVLPFLPSLPTYVSPTSLLTGIK